MLELERVALRAHRDSVDVPHLLDELAANVESDDDAPLANRIRESFLPTG